MKDNTRKQRRLTYATAGVNRSSREKYRDVITSDLSTESLRYSLGDPIRLPFGFVYPSDATRREFYDLQIEGIGTKTLLAELIGKYDTIGIDAVAMAVNDVIRSGAHPILMSDAIHIAASDKMKISSLIRSVREGARISGCILASGETGNVSEIFHQQLFRSSPPFDLIVSCLGTVKATELVQGNIQPGDVILGLRSSGIHSNGLTLARRVLLKPWGGRFDPWGRPLSIKRTVIEELLEPTRIYAKPVLAATRNFNLKAAVHITGDGFGKFHRLLNWRRKFKQSRVKIGAKFEGLRRMPGIFRLIHETARAQRTPISLAEMFKTFNMGYGFAIVVSKEQATACLAFLNKHCLTERIGTITSDGIVSIATEDSEKRLII